MKAPPLEYLLPASLDEAVATLAADEDAKVIAGGQSLVPLLALRLARPSLLVDVSRLGLDAVTVADGTLRLGATVRQRHVELDPAVGAAAPLLAAAAAQVGHPATRNMGTLGGSLAHADPVAELPAAAVALGASVVVVGPAGTRQVACADLANGFFTTVLPDEILTEVRLPVAGPRHGAAWREWAPRAHDFALAGVGVAVDLDAAGACVALRAAACGIGGGPLDLGPALAGAGGLGATPDALGGPLAAAVSAAARRAAVDGGAEADVADLTGLLAVQALAAALDRAADRGEGLSVRVGLEVNGEAVEVDLDARETLLDVLRHRLGLTGTHAGCEQGACGACTVLVDGAAVRSCLVLGPAASGRSVTTIEAVGAPGALHPVQQALSDHHGLQCGFCTPGMVLTAIDLLRRPGTLDEAAVRDALSGNLCRCTGYSGLVSAVLDLAGAQETAP